VGQIGKNHRWALLPQKETDSSLKIEMVPSFLILALPKN
jgi:hypothetical protein